MIEIIRNHAPMIPLLVDIDSAFIPPWILGYVPSSCATYYKDMDVDTAQR